VAAHRPTAKILAATPEPSTARELALEWGVWALTVPAATNAEQLLSATFNRAVAAGALVPGDAVVVTGSARLGVPGTTDLIQVVSVP
jgi:pyruvate kinase